MPSVTYKWSQKEGRLSVAGSVIASGYAGAPGYINDTASEQLHSKGPIPRGGYEITMIYPTHPKLGTTACVLKPDISNKMFGRSGFMIHADSTSHPRQASEGCIVLDAQTRRLFRVGDRIEVV